MASIDAASLQPEMPLVQCIVNPLMNWGDLCGCTSGPSGNAIVHRSIADCLRREESMNSLRAIAGDPGCMP